MYVIYYFYWRSFVIKTALCAGVIVKDGTVDGAYDEAMKDIEICIHSAAPCTCAFMFSAFITKCCYLHNSQH